MRPDDERITVLVADNDDHFRRTVEAVLVAECDIAVVGQARDGGEALALAEELAPDVILLDITMPFTGGATRGGIEAAAAISRQLPTTKIVMLTASDAEDDVYEALRAGAGGYVLKGDCLDDLAGVVRTMAHDRGLLLPPSIAAKMLAQFKETPPGVTDPGLSDRELQVLGLVGRGDTNDQIADELFLSSHTVKRHVANILAKLQQRTRADAVRHAVRNGYMAGTPIAVLTPLPSSDAGYPRKPGRIAG
jgi:DNA-binding NarL/FixJ family response regulator